MLFRSSTYAENPFVKIGKEAGEAKGDICEKVGKKLRAKLTLEPPQNLIVDRLGVRVLLMFVYEITTDFP